MAGDYLLVDEEAWEMMDDQDSVDDLIANNGENGEINYDNERFVVYKKIGYLKGSIIFEPLTHVPLNYKYKGGDK